MLRSISKLRQPLKGAAATIGNQYGILARVSVGDVPSYGDEVRREPSENIANYEKYSVYKTETSHKLHVNVEELDKELQTFFAERYLKTIKERVDANEITRISFNFVNEDVFRRLLNMPIRKLGYNSSFQRYNDDRGLAVFKVKGKQTEDVDNKRIGAYHRMAYTKSRKADILNLIM